MLTYIAILVVVIAVLYGSFRALSGGTPLAPAEYRTVLARIRDLAAAQAAALSDALEALHAPASESTAAGGRTEDAKLVDAAAGARRRLGGYRQQLAGMQPDAGGVELDELEAARSLLAAAVDDLAWACRLIEGGTYADNPGIRAAVAELREHAQACLGATAAALDQHP